MSSEAQLVLDVWEAVRDHLPHNKRPAVAQELLYAFQEYGFEGNECETIVDEDPDLANAFERVFAAEDEEEEGDA